MSKSVAVMCGSPFCCLRFSSVCCRFRAKTLYAKQNHQWNTKETTPFLVFLVQNLFLKCFFFFGILYWCLRLGQSDWYLLVCDRPSMRSTWRPIWTVLTTTFRFMMGETPKLHLLVASVAARNRNPSSQAATSCSYAFSLIIQCRKKALMPHTLQVTILKQYKCNSFFLRDISVSGIFD